jgi:lipoprotein-anchoring transpeptidase ErfK/SrfK
MSASVLRRSLTATAASVAILAAPCAVAQPLGYAAIPAFPGSVFERVMPAPQDRSSEEATRHAVPDHLRRQIVSYPTDEPAGTVIVDTANTYLYYVLGNGRAIRYGIGVGREGFTWSGVKTVGAKAEWPDWIPPEQMLQRQPYLPRWVAGGPGNPLGARAIYLADSLYRIHGTNAPESIGQNVSSGCIRMLNEDVIDLYERVKIGTKVVVLPDRGRNAGRSAPRHSEAPRAPLARIY